MKVLNYKIIYLLLISKECLNLSNGVLTKGLRTSIVSMEETTEDVFSKFNAKNASDENRKNMINNFDYVTSGNFHRNFIV